MPPQTRKRKATEEALGASKVGSVAAPPARKKRQPAKRQRAKGKAKKTDEDADENDEDFGRNDGKLFFKQASNSKDKKISASSVKQDIQDALERLLERLEQEDGDQQHHDMAAELHEYLPKNTEQIILHGDERPNTSFDPAFAALKQMSETVSIYRSLSESTAIPSPDWLRWEQDHKSLVKLNDCALTVAARQINSIVIPGKKMDMKPEKASDVEQLAWEMFEECRPKNQEKTWGGIAVEQVRAFVGLLGGVVGSRQ